MSVKASSTRSPARSTSARRAATRAAACRSPCCSRRSIASWRNPCAASSALSLAASRPARSSRSRALERIVGQLGGLREVPCRLAGGSERACTVARSNERRPCPLAKLRRVRVARTGAIGVEVMRGEHSRDLVVAIPLAGRCAAAARCRAFRSRTKACRRRRGAADPGGTRAGSRSGESGSSLDREDLLAQQRLQMRLELGLAEAGERGEPLARERLAEHGRILHEPPLDRLERVEPRGRERVQRLGDLERLDRAGRAVLVAVTLQQAAVEQHPHGLDRVERHALGPLDDPLPAARRAGRARGRRAARPSPRPASGSRKSDVKSRRPAPHAGRRSASSGRASVST